MSHDIEVRKVPFEFADDVPAVWNPGRPEWSHMMNGASLTMPYLEPFLIKNVREALESIDDEELRADAKAFVGQEAQHYTNHRRYNESLKNQGYSILSDVEDTFVEDYKRLEKRSLAWRLAYTAGFESMTMGVTEWLINKRESLFRDADPRVVSLVLWHMVEETEHKSVAFDVFQNVSGNYWLRLVGLWQASWHVAVLSQRGYKAMLIQDGLWSKFGSRMKLWAMLARFFLNVSPAMLRAALPWHHPDQVSDPLWVQQWAQSYSTIDDDHLPILDTRGPDIAPTFATT